MEKEQLRLIINIAIENKKRLYKLIWKNYGNMGLLLATIDDFEYDRMPEEMWHNYAEKGYARQLYVIYQAMEPILNKLHKPQNGWYTVCENRSQILIACERIHKKFWERFHKVYGEKAKANGGWPHMNKTQALKEFLAMGFVYKTDIDYDPKKHYCVQTHIGGLWWPKAFESHQAAIAIQNKYGIPGYTGTTIPK